MSLKFTIYEKEGLISYTVTGPYESALVKYVIDVNTLKHAIYFNIWVASSF